MLTRSHRLRDRKDVSRVYRNGKTERSTHMSLKWLETKGESSRAAVVVSKKTAARAPDRNRIRRRIYEALRRSDIFDARPVDMLITVFSKDIATMPSQQLTQELDSLLKKSL